MSLSPRPRLLFLAHLLPWPLTGGGQIKSYHTLRVLASRFEVTLLAFIRGEEEIPGIAALESFCEERVQTILLRRSRGRDLAAALRAAGTGTSLLIARDASAEMQAVVRETLASKKFAAVHVDHLQMMAFVPATGDPLLAETRILLDQHNVEHRIVQRVTEIDQGTPSLLRWAAGWDLPRLRQFEQAACRRADRVLVVSEEDAGGVAELIGKETAAERVRVTPIGVDTDYFAPASSRRASEDLILTVGTMYWPPNIDAVRWFCAEILPLIRRELPDARFQIVGTKPTKDVLSLASAQPEAVTVTASVPDVRPFMDACGVFVVPIRAGSGMRVKILNAMAMGLPIISTTFGAEGIAVADGESILLADTPAEFSAAVVRVLTDAALARRLGNNARDLALDSYAWQVVERPLLSVYGEPGFLPSLASLPEESVMS